MVDAQDEVAVAVQGAALHASLEFVKLTDLTQEQRAQVEESLAIIKDRQVTVSNKGHMKPKAVAVAVQKQIPWRFAASSHHARAVAHFKVKPAVGTDRSDTDTRYCIYDAAYDDYVYTPAWVQKLTRELVVEPDLGNRTA